MLVGEKGRKLRIGLEWAHHYRRRRRRGGRSGGDQGRRRVVGARDQGVEGVGDRDPRGASWAEVLTLPQK